MSGGPAKHERNGALRIPMRFEDALKAALEVRRPEEKRPKKKGASRKR